MELIIQAKEKARKGQIQLTMEGMMLKFCWMWMASDWLTRDKQQSLMRPSLGGWGSAILQPTNKKNTTPYSTPSSLQQPPDSINPPPLHPVNTHISTRSPHTIPHTTRIASTTNPITIAQATSPTNHGTIRQLRPSKRAKPPILPQQLYRHISAARIRPHHALPSECLRLLVTGLQ